MGVDKEPLIFAPQPQSYYHAQIDKNGNTIFTPESTQQAENLARSKRTLNNGTDGSL